MKTTELYLEQVLIGFLIVAIGAVPWARDLWSAIQTAGPALGVAGGSAALSLAFWLGIPFDRLADSLCDRLDTRNRLAFAIKIQSRKKKETSTDRKVVAPTDRNGDPISDPYPEDLFLILCRRDQPTIIRNWDYLRSRIRLSRALAVYVPALTFVTTLAIACWKESGGNISPSTAAVWFGIVAAAYLIWLRLVLVFPKKLKLPRTDDRGEFEKYCIEQERAGSGELKVWRAELRTWIIPVLLLAASVAIGLIKLCDDPMSLAAVVALAGAGLTAVSALSWWRISTTYRQFLLDCWQFRDHTNTTKVLERPQATGGSSSPQNESDHHGTVDESADPSGRNPDPPVLKSGDDS